jgi:1-aminocyclopropane-1-carboxylate deaminase/D-cysteine desulfhydrase-like pyridoxal-dependent ACC family enzyme
MNSRLKILQERLSIIPQTDYPLHSRVHPLRSFSFPSTSCFVKRDDELGFGVSGSKIRKYRSLIPFLRQENMQEVVLIGSAYSNHVLSFSQLLVENGIRVTPFLRGTPNHFSQGNALLTSLFVPVSSIHWFSKEKWKEVETHAHDYAQQQPHATFVLPEGGFIREALPGALSLALDLLKNEEEQGFTFDHIFLEAGTGLMESALILGLSWLGRSAHIHVILLAEDQEAFIKRLTTCYQWFLQLMQSDAPFPHPFTLHLPHLTGSFGHTSSSIFETLADLARKEGFLTDPIYTTKLFIESQRILKQEDIRGNILIHHSGGALTLMGFQDRL